MKKQIETAKDLFGQLLVVLLALFAASGGKAAAVVDEEEEEETPPPAKKPAGKPAKASKPAPDEEEEENDMLGGEEEEEEEPEITIKDLKELGQKVLKAGKADKLKAILKKNGAENLGGLDEAKYGAVHAALSKLL